VSGQSRLANMVFSALTFTVGIPSAIKVFNWAATLYKGDIRLNTPMLYGLSFLLLFTIGGLTGLFLGILSVDVHLHDTYFVVAHFHYVMMGSTLVAFLGALHHWWPKFTGRMYPEQLGRLCATGVFFGFNLTFMPQFVMGARGMPRRYWDYDPQYTLFHQLSTIGAYILGLSLFITVVYLMRSFWVGPKARRNPWGGSTLEWQAPTPPPLYNFEKPPVLHELYNYDDLVEVEENRWERETPIETDHAKADTIARSIGAAADHTGGATTAEKAEAMIHSKAEEVRSGRSVDESSKGKPLEAGQPARDRDQVDAAKVAGGGEVMPAATKHEAAKAEASDDDKKGDKS
jgi:heme/copper-type cytochrome/quinol oxidase subunit 1